MRATDRAWRKTLCRVFRIVGIVALLAVLIGVVFAQRRGYTAEKSAPNGIVRGTVVAVSPAAIEVRDAQGTLRRLAVDRTTLVLSDAEDFSVATLPDIQLAVSDLSDGDRVEVIVEPDQKRLVAGIVTRLSPIDATSTAKAGPR